MVKSRKVEKLKKLKSDIETRKQDDKENENCSCDPWSARGSGVRDARR